MTARRSLIYVLPRYDEGGDDHFVHSVEFIRALAERADVFVIAERGNAVPRIPGVVGAHLQRFADNPVARVLEIVWVVLRQRLRGWRDVYVRISIPAALPLSLLSPLLGIRVFYWNCGEGQVKPWRWGAIGAKLRGDVALRVVLATAHRLVTGTDTMARHYVKAFGARPERVTVVPNDVSLTRFAPATPEARIEARRRLGLPEDRVVVIAVHRLSPIRRTLFYLPAVLRPALARAPRPYFVFVGGGPEEAELGAALADPTLAGDVRMVGSVPNRALGDYYAAADAFIMPSYVEGFPRVLIEGMAAGLPFVSTDAGGVRDVVGPELQTSVVPRDDLSAFGAALERLVGDAALRTRLGALSRARAGHYDTDVVRDIFVERILRCSCQEGADAT